jgi:hypothetical protein
MSKYIYDIDDMFDDMFYEFDKVYDFLSDNDGYKYSLPIEYYDMAKVFLDSIEKYLNENPDYKKEFNILQIKTKFRSIRVYFHPRNESIDSLIKTLCEDCDKIGKREGCLLIWKKGDV